MKCDGCDLSRETLKLDWPNQDVAVADGWHRDLQFRSTSTLLAPHA